ncbi:MAG: hypothetical protein RL153_1125 [Verrucomicrobiota bacterium]
MNTTAASTRQQLGLDLGRAPRPARPQRPARRPCSRERALWWFQQMRRAVGEPEPKPHDVRATPAGLHLAG